MPLFQCSMAASQLSIVVPPIVSVRASGVRLAGIFHPRVISWPTFFVQGSSSGPQRTSIFLVSTFRSCAAPPEQPSLPQVPPGCW
jgi:hypothetical protein